MIAKRAPGSARLRAIGHCKSAGKWAPVRRC